MRLFVIGLDGKVTYTGGRGPREFNPDSWEANIKQLIAS